MSRLADAYGWSKKDLSSFTGGEILQIVQKLTKKQKEMSEQGLTGFCPMMRVLSGK